ncbi:MAG TPA: capsule assembly Wzi family protein [Steroidobacteraceae bacterium]|nr:capsule assembly Wzi family protein [Steroidobacteraceae bacterium]
MFRLPSTVIGPAFVAALFFSTIAHATDWFAPGDARLRSDLKLLADAGELNIPMSAWPLPVADVERALAERKPHDSAGSVAGALARVTEAVERAKHHGDIDVRLTAGRPPLVQTFDQTPREEGEAQGSLAWQAGGFSGVVSVEGVVDPDDNQAVRPDGSYLAYDFKRWQIRAGWIDRYWGSGADGSLILSTNARPVPTIGFERTVSTAPETSWLHWIGPWRAGMFIGQMENHRDDFDHPVFFGMHLEWKPLENLDFGFYRTAQLCGEGRKCGASTFWDMLLGHDNVGINVSQEDQPGNQMGGIDVRWAHPIGKLPYAIYASVIGEDGKKGVPVKALRNIGLETTFSGDGAGYLRARLEYTDTKCTSKSVAKEFNCAYRNGVFPYRYRGRIIGSSLDNDTAMWALGIDHVLGDGTTASTALRFADVNRGGAPDPTHAISPTPMKLWELEGRVRRDFHFGTVDVSLIVDQMTDRLTDRDEIAIRGFLSWSRRFGN